MTEIELPSWYRKAPQSTFNKYDRGHTLVYGGRTMHGAGILAANSALKIGSGLVSLSVPREQLDLYGSFSPDILLYPRDQYSDFLEHSKQRQVNTLIIGPGLDLDDQTVRSLIESISLLSMPVVLDAGALIAFEGHVAEFFYLDLPQAVLTPHEGEFEKIFTGLSEKSREDRATRAAELSDTIVVLKGKNTVVASPSGDIFVNKEDTPYLATAGTGDVLAGMIGGFLAQGLSCFDAAKSAVILHGRAAIEHGPGLTASALCEEIPSQLKKELEKSK